MRKVTVKEIEIKMSGDDAFCLAMDICELLSHKIDKHYHKFDYGTFIANEQDLLTFVKQLLGSTNNVDVLTNQESWLKNKFNGQAEEAKQDD